VDRDCDGQSSYRFCAVLAADGWLQNTERGLDEERPKDRIQSNEETEHHVVGKVALCTIGSTSMLMARRAFEAHEPGSRRRILKAQPCVSQ